MAKIFISYRRDDSKTASGRIYDDLVTNFAPDDVFKDVDNIPPGADFGEYIQKSLRECDVELVVIGPSWLDVRNPNGERRLDDPADFVRIEVETALALGLEVIPLLVEGAQVPTAAELPESLRKLVQKNCVLVRDDPDFHRDMKRVIAHIKKMHPTPSRSPAPDGQREATAPPQAPTPSVPAGNRLPPGWFDAAVAAPARPARAKPNRTPWLIGGSVTVVLVLVIMVVLNRGTSPRRPAATNPYLRSVAMVSATEGWAVGASGTILHYSGGHWTSVTSPTSKDLTSLAMISATEGWAVGSETQSDGATILHYNGGKWTAVTSPTTLPLTSVAMVSATDGWAVSDNGVGDKGVFLKGVFLHYSGGHWTTVTSPTTTHLRSVAMVSAADGWAVGDNGVILHYNGAQWTTVTSPNSKDLNGVTTVSATEGWAVGDNVILHYSSGRWTNVSIPSSALNPFPLLTGVAMVSATEGWAVGGNGVILHYSGGHWTTVTSPTSEDLTGVTMVSATEGWAVGYGETILHYNSGRWVKASSPSS